MNTLDIVTPTMWRGVGFIEQLKEYCSCDSVKNIFLIDNDKSKRPKDLILQHPKIKIICYDKNIFVNPAWNEGYYRSKADVICFLNDDIQVDTKIFDDVTELDFTDIDIIGVHLKGSVDNYHIVNHLDNKEELIRLNVDKNQPIGGQAYAFGVCMFIKRTSYKVIPGLYQIWYGDDYLIQNNKNIFALKTSKIKGEISKTIVDLTKNKKGEVQKRIDLDTKNAYKFNHFRNAKNWDILKNKMPKEEKNTISLHNEYEWARKNPSDINENVHILYDLAKECTHVTEMGVRTGVSTRALLNSDVELISYDLFLDKYVSQLFDTARKSGKNVNYIKADVLEVDIQETDMLFIDTLHVYEQLKKELNRHANKVKKYIAFHDTYTFGLRGEDGKDKKGLLSAIIEFLIENKNWKFKIYKTNNNGFTVLERVN